MSNNKNIDNNVTNKCIKFPLTQYFYKEGIKRCNEPYDYEEETVYCGTHDRCCIDCYLCFTPICFIFDISSCFLFQCFRYNKNEDNINNKTYTISDV